MRAAVVRGANIFRTEIQTARRLGFTLTVKTEDRVLGMEAFARLTPTTASARAACAVHGEPGKDCIEARQSYSDPRDMLDAIRQTVDSVLEMAGGVMA